MGYDGIVIGGGAAGMFAAITAAKRGQKVLLLEKNELEAASKKLDEASELCCFINKKGQH